MSYFVLILQKSFCCWNGFMPLRSELSETSDCCILESISVFLLISPGTLNDVPILSWFSSGSICDNLSVSDHIVFSWFHWNISFAMVSCQIFNSLLFPSLFHLLVNAFVLFWSSVVIDDHYLVDHVCYWHLAELFGIQDSFGDDDPIDRSQSTSIIHDVSGLPPVPIITLDAFLQCIPVDCRKAS